MTHKLILTILGLALFIPGALAYTDITERVIVEHSNLQNRNIVISRDGERWLLHYSGTCTKPETGDSVILSVRNSLDGSGDSLKTSTYHRCEIDQAERIDKIVKVEKIYGGKTHVVVSDETNHRYSIHFPTICSPIKGFLGQHVYLRSPNPAVSSGDRYFLPRGGYECNLTYVQDLEADENMPTENLTVAEVAEQNKTQIELLVSDGTDIKRPTSIGNPRAIAGPGKAYVYWRAAKDNVGVDHYVVAYSRYRINTENFEIKDADSFVTSDKNSAMVPDLNVNEIYFFAVKAVDAEGNESSDWSEVVTATPRKIRSIGNLASANIYLKKTQETDLSFLFRWSKTTRVVRQTVALKVDGERTFAFSDWSKPYIRISKTIQRKGKELKLLVRTFSSYGVLDEQEIEFEF